MIVRIIRGKLRPGTWEAYEAAYKAVLAEHGRFKGLVSRWLVRDTVDRDAGYSISLWADEASMKAYESSDTLKNIINPKLQPFFSGEYTTTHCEMRSHENFSLG